MTYAVAELLVLPINTPCMYSVCDYLVLVSIVEKHPTPIARCSFT